MPTQEITVEQAAKNVYNVSHSALHVVSGVYKGMLATSKYIDTKMDNTFGRLSGISYYAKTLHAVIGGLKDVQTKHVAEILLDGDKNFKDKVKHSVKHVKENFSHESTVGAGMFFLKEAVIIAPLALGVSALVGLMAPAAATTAGIVAGVGLMKAAKYYLATHAGHKLETTMAEKIKAGMKFLTGFRKAAKGKDPEMNQVVEIADKMEAAAHAHGHGREHGVGHQHHHKLGHTLKQDLVALIRVDKYPKELATYVKTIAMDCVSLYNKVTGQSPVVKQELKAAGQHSDVGAPTPGPGARQEEPHKPSETKKPKASTPKM